MSRAGLRLVPAALQNLVTAAGDLIVGTGARAAAPLAIGPNKRRLGVVNDLPSWEVDPFAEEALEAGERTYHPQMANVATVSMTSGVIRLRYFVAKRTENINTLATLCGTVIAGTVTRCRMGIYSIAANGDGTLIASTPNDVGLWAVQSTRYPKGLSATWPKVKGTRYAFATIFVGTTAPSLVGYNLSAALVTTLAGPPRICGQISAQTDLLGSFTAAQVTDSGGMPLGEMLP